MIIIIMLYALSSLKLILSKQALSYIPPIFLVALHNGIAGLLLLAYHYLRGNSLFIHRIHIVPFLKAIVFGVYIPYVLRFWGLQYIPTYKASLLLGIAPFISYFMCYMIDDEVWTWTKFSGLCLGFLGIIPILILETPAETTLTNFFHVSTAELATLASTISLLYGWMSIKNLAKTELYSPAFLNGVGMACGGLLALGTSVFKETLVLPSDNLITLAANLAFIVFIGNIFVHTLYVDQVKKFNVTVLSLAKLLSPIFTAFYGWLFFGEIITWHFFAGFFCLMMAFIIFYSEEIAILYSKQSHRTS